MRICVEELELNCWCRRAEETNYDFVMEAIKELQGLSIHFYPEHFNFIFHVTFFMLHISCFHMFHFHVLLFMFNFHVSYSVIRR